MLTAFDGGRPADETIGVVFCVVATLSNALMMTFSGRIMGPERLNALYLTFYTSPVVLGLLAVLKAPVTIEREGMLWSDDKRRPEWVKDSLREGVPRLELRGAGVRARLARTRADRARPA